MSSNDVREHNLGLVLSHLDRAGAAARSELAEATGLTSGAITLLVSELIAAGLVRSVPVSDARTGGKGVGRPRERLEIDGRAFALVGVQFVVDEVLVSAVDLAGRPLRREAHAVRTPYGDPEALVAQLDALIDGVVTGLRAEDVLPMRLVVVVPAPVVRGSEMIPVAIDLGWTDVDLGGLLRRRGRTFPLGVHVVNDANSAAYAEFAELQARGGVSDMLYLKSDTGIGGGAIVAGEILSGSDGVAFEPGHMVVVPDGAPCACGKRGCLVTVAGPDVVLVRAGLEAYRLEHGLPRALAELTRRYRRGDGAAVVALDAALSWIRLALVNCIVVLQPRFVVVGGYLSDLVEELRPLPLSPPSTGGAASDDAEAGVLSAAHGLYSGVDGALLHDRRELLRAPGSLSVEGIAPTA
ncbi:ROK family transcriptional regulator [Microbacterium betulae]|uniref:ROK family transcriptional regulator n=1 Tax=Microbacterium betulae TaxID=2981139 RepID=A0AA97FFC0_9MICO|nr:ROK family transcriptional regulator [Microbacterium sp. AB]WOF21558.1 ROK family transcriptional regulator [Microbacterium sp. AB]